MYTHDNAAAFGALAAPREGTAHLAYQEIRRLRARWIGDLIASFLWSLSKAARRTWRRLRRARGAALTTDALLELDDRALRDIGLQRRDLGATMRDDWRMTA